MSNYEEKPDFEVNQANQSSTGTIAAIVIALVLVVGAFVFFGSWNAPHNGPLVTQNNASLPAPVIESPAAPAQNMAPVVPVTPPVNPPASAPATSP